MSISTEPRKNILDFSQVKSLTITNSIISDLANSFKIENCFNLAGIIKTKGVSIFMMFCLLFLITAQKKRSIHEGLKSEGLLQFRTPLNDFLNNEFFDWRKLLFLVNKVFYKKFRPDADEVNCFIIDDSAKEKTGRHAENISWFYDHSNKSKFMGFQAVFGLFLNGRTANILDFVFKIGKQKCKDSKRGKYPSDSHIAHRQKEGLMSKIQISIAMIGRALKQGFKFDYVLWDSWYNSTKSFKYVFETLVPKGIHLISMVKLDKRKYLHKEKEYEVKELYKFAGNWNQIEDTNIFAKSLLVNIIDVDDKERKSCGEVKICFYKYIRTVVKKRKNKKSKTKKTVKYKAVVSTNTALSEAEIYKLYAKRWSVEVVIKDMKENFGFHQSMSSKYAPQIADFTIKCIIYLMVCSLKERSPNKSPYQLLFDFVQELETHNIDTFVKMIMHEKILEFLYLAAEMGFIEIKSTKEKLEELLYDFIHAEKYIDKIEEIDSGKKRRVLYLNVNE
jgi:hypothetical protein